MNRASRGKRGTNRRGSGGLLRRSGRDRRGWRGGFGGRYGGRLFRDDGGLGLGGLFRGLFGGGRTRYFARFGSGRLCLCLWLGGFLVLLERLFLIGGRAVRARGMFFAEQAAQVQNHVVFERAGVRLLIGDAKFGEPVQQFVRFHFQLPRQLIDSNLLHR